MINSKFKVGDRIRAKNDSHKQMGINSGDICTVRKVAPTQSVYVEGKVAPINPEEFRLATCTCRNSKIDKIRGIDSEKLLGPLADGTTEIVVEIKECACCGEPYRSHNGESL